MAVGGTSRDLRLNNRSLVLREIVRSREVTRAGLAAAVGRSAATVTNVVSDLVREGLVEELGQVPSEGGRPIARLGLRADGAYLLGVDVGEKGVAVELFDLRLERLDREFREGGTRQADPCQVARALTEAVSAVRQRNPQAEARLVGLGLGLPGIVEDPDGSHEGGGVVLHARSLDWPAIRIDDLIDAPGLEVFADNGAKTLATAEMWFGAARGVSHAAVALLGRGVGMGLVADGELLRGSASSAGEWGHTKVDPGGRVCRCGGRGCLETYLGADALLDRWRESGAEPEGNGWRAVTALVDAAEAGDPAATAVVDEAVGVLALAFANLVNLLNPQQIIVGGWVGLCLMRTRAAEIERRTRELSLPRPGSQFSLRLCRFEGDAVALGAALLPLERLIDRPIGPDESLAGTP